jgi:hypothetical protein
MQFPYTYGIAFSSLENAAATNIFAKSWKRNSCRFKLWKEWKDVTFEVHTVVLPRMWDLWGETLFLGEGCQTFGKILVPLSSKARHWKTVWPLKLKTLHSFNLLTPSVALRGRAVRHLNQPHGRTSTSGVANMCRIWKDFVHPCMLGSYVFSSRRLPVSVKAALCVRISSPPHRYAT